jgi:hypothetical protein
LGPEASKKFHRACRIGPVSNVFHRERVQVVNLFWRAVAPNSFTDGEAEMPYRPAAPEPKASGKLRELVLLFVLIVAFGTLVTAGAIWATWDGGGIIP